jgi:hypothetical protein
MLARLQIVVVQYDTHDEVRLWLDALANAALASRRAHRSHGAGDVSRGAGSTGIAFRISRSSAVPCPHPRAPQQALKSASR